MLPLTDNSRKVSLDNYYIVIKINFYYTRTSKFHLFSFYSLFHWPFSLALFFENVSLILIH